MPPGGQQRVRVLDLRHALQGPLVVFSDVVDGLALEEAVLGRVGTLDVGAPLAAVPSTAGVAVGIVVGRRRIVTVHDRVATAGRRVGELAALSHRRGVLIVKPPCHPPL